MSKRLRIYVAGAYSAGDVLSIMGNMRRGIQLSADTAAAGFAVYSPWCDFPLHFQRAFTLADCYAYSLPWCEVSDAVLVVEENSESSVGTQAEIARAEELGIPVFYSLQDLIDWRDQSWE